MTFPYRKVFQQLEKSLIEYGAERLSLAKIHVELEKYKNLADQKLIDDNCFSTLRNVVFYSGFRADIVSERQEIINYWFPDLHTVSNYSDGHVRKIMSDSRMIRNKRKIDSCIYNAKLMYKLIEEYGSFSQYIDSFTPKESFENLLLLKEELEARFHYLGGITVYHFLTDLGMPVLKPDRVICRIFKRLGLIESDRQLLKTVIRGRKFAEATNLPIRYIDIIFVAYGQARFTKLGIDRGICLKNPRCLVCGIKQFCQYHKNTSNPYKADPSQ